jgi:hypothetical protein
MNLFFSWSASAALAVCSLALAGTASLANRAIADVVDQGPTTRQGLLEDRNDHSGGLALTAASTQVASGPLRQPAEGEDIGSTNLPHVLIRIGQQMRSVQRQLVQRDTTERTQTAQAQIIEQLTALIDQLGNERTAADASERSSPLAGKDPAGSAGQVPPTEPRDQGATRLDQPAAVELDAPSVRKLITDRWGHLPAAMREPMLSVEIERFLPKYESLLERYYERLAQEPDAWP